MPSRGDAGAQEQVRTLGPVGSDQAEPGRHDSADPTVTTTAATARIATSTPVSHPDGAPTRGSPRPTVTVPVQHRPTLAKANPAIIAEWLTPRGSLSSSLCRAEISTQLAELTASATGARRFGKDRPDTRSALLRSTAVELEAITSAAMLIRSGGPAEVVEYAGA
jgi:hypothetical protein